MNDIFDIWRRDLINYFSNNKDNIYSDSINGDDYVLVFRKDGGADQYDRLSTIDELIAAASGSASNLAYVSDPTIGTITNSNGTGVVLPAGTNSDAGLLTAVKFNEVASNNAFRINPESIITAGTGLVWAGNILNAIGMGTGDMVGPASAIDSNLVAFDTTSGKLTKDSLLSITTVAASITHITSSGSDHSFIDQSVTTLASPTFVKPTINSLQINLLAAVSVSTGEVAWNPDEGTFDFGLLNGVVWQGGQEQPILTKNQTGIKIFNGTPVMFAGSTGASGRVKIMPAIADGTFLAGYMLGVTTQDIENGDDGYIVPFGKIRGIQTDGVNYGESWNDSDIIYVSVNTAGYLTNVAPTAPNLRITVGIVVYAHASNGTLFSRPTWRGTLEGLDDVNGTALTTDGQLAVWDNGNSYFDFTYNINDYELLSNKVTSISGASTDIQYGSAKLLYDQLALKANIAQTFYIGTTQIAINRASAALTLAGLTLTTPDIGTPSAGILTNCTFPTLNQNTSGTAAGLSSTLVIGSGGTGLFSIADGSVLATNSANVLSAITWHSAGTKVLTNTSGTISWEDASGGSISFGASTQIPYTNTTTDDFLYSANLSFDGTTLDIIGKLDIMTNVGNLTLIGRNAGLATSSITSLYVGENSGQSSAGSNNTGIGQNALRSGGGSFNTFIGGWSGYLNSSSGNNSGVGYRAGRQSAGSDLSFIGFQSGYLSTGTRLTGLGYCSLESNTGNDCVGIGYQALLNNATDNLFQVKQTNVNTTPLIQGDFASGALQFAGAITQHELSTDPIDPIEGSFVRWMSDGTGTGDDGDIIIKITAGGVTKTATLVDFSTI